MARFHIGALSTLCSLGAVWLFLAPASAQVTETIVGSLGPNFDSPSFSNWLNNANTALANNASIVGNPTTDPAAFVQGTTFVRSEIINPELLGFNAWHGIADPSGAFSGEFNNELDVQARFLGNGVKIKAANILFNWQDANGNFGFGGLFSPGFTYRPWRKGIDYGPDGILGTADDIVYDAGQTADTPVDEIDTNIDLSYLAGADTPLPPPGLTHQQQIDWSAEYAVANQYDSGVIIGGLSLYADDQTTLLAQGQVTFTAVPEPNGIALLLGAIVPYTAFLIRRHRAFR